MRIEGLLTCACLHGNDYQICINSEGEFHELHMGTPLEALIENEWIPTRIELDDEGNYYLVGIGKEIAFMKVRGV